jgi:energy-coupling factor transporter transmembrane protein EcfT
MKYKLTPINLICVILIGFSIYLFFTPGPMGFGFLSAIVLLSFGLLGIGIDYIAQKAIKKYLNLFLIEILLLGILTFGYMWTERSKTFIIPDQRDFEYIVTIYNIEQSEELPVDFFTWKYKKEIPKDGIILTSTEFNIDLPKTKIFTESGISLQDRKDTTDICFGRISTSWIHVDSKPYKYQAWKIDKGGTIGYSTEDIEKLENNLIKYLKKNKPSS